MANWAAIIAGLIFLYMGTVLDITVVGLPPGIGLDLVGLFLVIYGATGKKAKGSIF